MEQLYKKFSRKKFFCKRCKKRIWNKQNNALFCDDCVKEKVKFHNSKRKRKCRSCGKMCFGRICMKCHKKGRHSTVVMKRVNKRYRKRNKLG